MRFPNHVYTVESVLRGHPDKICDQISDSLLDLFLQNDADARTAIECLGTKDTLVVAGEVSSTAVLPIEQSCEEIYNQITGYSGLRVINLLSQQSPQLAKAVIGGGAGDQGVMYGYACDNQYNVLFCFSTVFANGIKAHSIAKAPVTVSLRERRLQVLFLFRCCL